MLLTALSTHLHSIEIHFPPSRCLDAFAFDQTNRSLRTQQSSWSVPLDRESAFVLPLMSEGTCDEDAPCAACRLNFLHHRTRGTGRIDDGVFPCKESSAKDKTGCEPKKWQ